MGLRCLLSHDFGEPELEREREEQGNEVVITVNEVKICSRCGERRIVSENTEVTSMEQLTATATADAPDAPADAGQSAPQQAASAGSAEPTGTEPNAGSDDLGVTLDDSVPTTEDAEVWTDEDDEPGDSTPEDLGAAEAANMTVDDVEAAAAEAAGAVESSSVDTDDGVILGDDDEDAEASAEQSVDREPGEWPEYDTGEDGDADGDSEWPNVEGDEGYSAEEPAAEEPEDLTFGGGFTPEITKAEAGSVADADQEGELSFTRAEESAVEYEATVDDIETEFYCPECGLSRLAGNSSMRAGDICPECKRGYISERPT